MKYTVEEFDKQYPEWYVGTPGIFDFTGYKKVEVNKIDPEMVGAQPKQCITNSKLLAQFDDQLIVQGFAQIKGVEYAFFHFWNYDPVSKKYFDCSPVGDIIYWIKDTQ